MSIEIVDSITTDLLLGDTVRFAHQMRYGAPLVALTGRIIDGDEHSLPSIPDDTFYVHVSGCIYRVPHRQIFMLEMGDE